MHNDILENIGTEPNMGQEPARMVPTEPASSDSQLKSIAGAAPEASCEQSKTHRPRPDWLPRGDAAKAIREARRRARLAEVERLVAYRRKGIKRQLEYVPAIHQQRYLDAVLGHAGLRAAINANCASCCCWQNREISLCTTWACPLWPYRPYQLTEAEYEDALRKDDPRWSPH